MSKVRELIDKANGLWAPQERPFTSSAPVIGPAIVSIRRGLNWMSAKWYVRPILEQQITFNSTIVQIINELGATVDNILSQLEQERERSSSLSNQIREAEDLTILNDRVTVTLTRDLARLRRCLARLNEATPVELSAPREDLDGVENPMDKATTALERDADSLL